MQFPAFFFRSMLYVLHDARLESKLKACPVMYMCSCSQQQHKRVHSMRSKIVFHIDMKVKKISFVFVDGSSISFDFTHFLTFSSTSEMKLEQYERVETSACCTLFIELDTKSVWNVVWIQQHEAIAVNFNELSGEQNRTDLMCIFVCLVGCFFSTLFCSVYRFFGVVEFYSSIIIIWMAQNEESFVLSDVIFDINRICSLN